MPAGIGRDVSGRFFSLALDTGRTQPAVIKVDPVHPISGCCSKQTVRVSYRHGQIKNMTARRTEKVRVRRHVGVETGIVLVNGQHPRQPVTDKKLQGIVNRSF